MAMVLQEEEESDGNEDLVESNLPHMDGLVGTHQGSNAMRGRGSDQGDVDEVVVVVAGHHIS